MTDDYTRHTDGKPSLTRAFRTMPKWKVLALLASLVIGVLGVGASVAAKHQREANPKTVVVHTVHAPNTAVAPPGSSGFVGGGAPSTPDQPQTTTTTTTVPADPTLLDKLSPNVAAIGFSFFVGLIFGVISRTFLKIATLLGGLAVAVVLAAHYFNINLDLTAVKNETGQATTWMSGQLGQFKDFLFAHLPSAGSATAGFLFGMKRR